MTQAIKYESTKIDAAKSAMEVGEMVQRYGARRFEIGWGDGGETTHVRFVLRVENAGETGEMPVRIEAKTDRVESILRRAHPSWTPKQAREQAYRVAWRHLRGLTEELLLAVHLGLKDVGGAFMDGVEVWDDVAGETVTAATWIARRAALPAGDDRGMRLLLPRSAA